METQILLITFCYRFYWEKKVVTEDSTQSLATVRFEIPDDTPLGTYRIRHQGFYKTPAGNLQDYVGYSSAFQVIVLHHE